MTEQPNREALKLVCKALNKLFYTLNDARRPDAGFIAMEWLSYLSEADINGIMWDNGRHRFATSIFDDENE